ncbi:MAG: aldehyde dehydrogenase [Leptospiraceae bacterium]|nr:MAG: aldehyde dehydrogenase [Leptospiraceae bacterium]
MELLSINPATEEVWERFPAHSGKDIISIIEQSEKAFHQWRKINIKKRKEYIKHISENLKNYKKEYAEIITKEMGKPIKESIAEIEKCALLCDYYYEHVENFLKPELRKGSINHAKENIVSFEPLGTILAIMPWNFPFWQVFRCAIPSILAGNCVILKHAPNVSKCSLTIENIFRESGIIENVFRSILIENAKVSEITEVLLSHPQIAGVTVTGSVNSGKSVAKIAGKYLKKSVMELGGSDPFIVLEDADIEEAAKTGALSRCQNTGQSCIAAKRFIIIESIYEEFKKIFINELNQYAHAIGNPLNENTKIGPIARKDLLDKLIEQVEDAKQKDATILMGGNKADFPKGYFYHLTVIENISKKMKAYQEEIFGPVVSLYKVSSIEEAIHLANDTPYGLGASLWTKNIDKAKEIIPELFFGNVFVNSLVKSDPGLPFGGIKESGYGRELSIEGIKEFVNIKTIRIY